MAHGWLIYRCVNRIRDPEKPVSFSIGAFRVRQDGGLYLEGKRPIEEGGREPGVYLQVHVISARKEGEAGNGGCEPEIPLHGSPSNPLLRSTNTRYNILFVVSNGDSDTETRRFLGRL